MTLPLEQKMDATISLHSITFIIISRMSRHQVYHLKKELFYAIKNLEKSPFKKVLSNATIFVGNKKDLNEEGFNTKSGFEYFPNTDSITYTLVKDMAVYPTIIHEFGHRFHHKFITEGFENPSFVYLYQKSLTSSHNYLEFFADMFTAITLGEVKPSEQKTADNFLSLVKQFSI